MPDAPRLSRLTYPALDGLRGIAVLVVLIHNLTILENRASIPEKFWVFATDAGWVGVQLFFVLSGFLITGILVDDRDKPRFYRNFYIRRVVRIFPLYYLMLLARFAIVPLVIPDSAVPFAAGLWYVLYVANWSALYGGNINGFAHFWSLAVEEQFYMLWPLAVARLRARGLAWCCVALIAASATARIYIYVTGTDPQWLYLSTVTRADALAFGALVALAIRDPRWRAHLARYLPHLAFVTFVGLCAIVANAHGLSRFNTLVETIGYSLLAIAFAIAVAYIALDETRTRPRFAMNRVLRTAGKYSYAAYVFHTPLKVGVLYYAKPWLVDHGFTMHMSLDMAWVLVLTAGSFALAKLSYVVLERPLLALKDRWAPR